jgi:hypothetical protein
VENTGSGWLKRQWDDIKGNFKWWLLALLGTGVVTVAVALTHGL